MDFGDSSQKKSGFLLSSYPNANDWMFIPTEPYEVGGITYDLSNAFLTNATSHYNLGSVSYGRDTFVSSTNSNYNYGLMLSNPVTHGENVSGFAAFWHSTHKNATGNTNRRFVSMSYNKQAGIYLSLPTNDISMTGDVAISTDGQSWTIKEGVLPAAVGTWIDPVYNEDDSRWVTAINGQGTSAKVGAYSDDNGNTWTPFTLPYYAQKISYGDGKFVFTSGLHYVHYYSNSEIGSTLPTTNYSFFSGSGGTYVYGITYNKHSQFFLACGGAYSSPNHNGFISKSLDGVTWSTLFDDLNGIGNSGTNSNNHSLFNNVIGSDDGKFIVTGWKYSSGSWLSTDKYLYSSDYGVTFEWGTLPQSVKPSFSLTDLTWGSPNISGSVMPITDPAYYISSDVDASQSITESGNITYTISTTNVLDNTTLYWSLSGVTATDIHEDSDGSLVNGVLSGSFQIIDNVSNTPVFIKMHQDYSTEGNESMTFNLRVGSAVGSIVASDTVTIVDTSVTYVPPPVNWPPLKHCTIEQSSVEVHTPLNSTASNLVPYSFTFNVINPNPPNVTQHYLGSADLVVNLEYIIKPNSPATDSASTPNFTVSINKNAGGTSVTVTGTGIVGFVDEVEFTWRIKATTNSATSGNPNDYTVDLKLIRDPYVLSIDPPHGSTITVPTNINISGAEPNSPFVTGDFNNTTLVNPLGQLGESVSNFNGSGQYTYANYYKPYPEHPSNIGRYWLQNSSSGGTTFYHITTD